MAGRQAVRRDRGGWWPGVRGRLPPRLATRLPTLRTVALVSWPLLQSTIAGTIAWEIATRVAGHHQPFFAPIAAVVALNQSMGERGTNAVRLLVGVVVGIVAGEVTMAGAGESIATLPVATFAAMAVARALDPARIVTAQAAAGAILTVAAGGQVGPQRLGDALIGAGVALVFSQLLFSREPITLVRRAEVSALTGMADGLQRVVRALERGDDEPAGDAVGRLRSVRDSLAEVSRAARASGRVARHTLLWRARQAPVVRENENAAHLDLLAGSCLMLARAAREVSRSEGRRLAPPASGL